VSATKITATAPPASTGTVDVTVTTGGGTSTTNANDQYTYVVPPVAGAVSATVGYDRIGDAITLNRSGVAAIDPAHARIVIGDARNDRVQVFSIDPLVNFAAVLPGSRSVMLGNTATIFASVINAGSTPLDNCRATLPVTAPAGLTLSYQTTDPITNAPVGIPNTPATIAGNDGLQTFLLSFQGSAAFSAPSMPLDFDCDGVAPATIVTGVDTVDLVMSTTPTADIIALAATPTNNGIFELPVGGSGAFFCRG
jgi:hypothetical protein